MRIVEARPEFSKLARQGRCDLRPKYWLHEGDLSPEGLDELVAQPVAGCDTETSGLDFRTDRIALFQAWSPSGIAHIVRIGQVIPNRVLALLADTRVRKVFHHAAFDLRFMAYHWRAHFGNVGCTKIASKVLSPSESDHTLVSVLRRHLDVMLDKSARTSDWFTERLEEDQIQYAVRDVMYLPTLLEILLHKLSAKGEQPLVEECFQFLPAHVQLHIRGYENIYCY